MVDSLICRPFRARSLIKFQDFMLLSAPIRNHSGSIRKVSLMVSMLTVDFQLNVSALEKNF